jgi:hypothetical protein
MLKRDVLKRQWKINDLVLLFHKSNQDNNVTDVGIIKSFNNIDDDIYADIKLLYSKYSPIDTFIHAQREDVFIIGDETKFE